MMNAVVFDPAADTFMVQQVPVPQPDAQDVLIRVEACGLNPVDAKINRRKKSLPNQGAGWIMGLDVSGYIEALGPNVTDWKAGDRVLYHGNLQRPHGGFAEYALQKASTLIPHPNVSAVTAAATPCAGWTAWRAVVDKLRITSADSIFIAGGAGGVGSFALQIARHFDLFPIITTCSPENEKYVRELGATHVIDYHKGSIAEQVLAITQDRGVTKGLDAVGPDNDIDVANALSFEGEMVELVGLTRPEKYKNSFGRGLGFQQFSLGSAHQAGAAGEALLRQVGQTFSRLVEDGTITVPVTRVVSMDEVAQSLVAMRNQTGRGKVVTAL
ncbi:zinc-binding dehydrogenase [Nibrella saemangeumensis]|uniref:Zinc-binding dehydrogenase n=1 Tax=Nibrella saemangeumensis TaxID=1084526 RepID=A0ABP8MCI1_9BACT